MKHDQDATGFDLDSLSTPGPAVLIGVILGGLVVWVLAMIGALWVVIPYLRGVL